MLGQHHRAVQHAGHAHVVDERLLAERLLERRPAARPTRPIPLLRTVPVPFGERGVAAQAELLAEVVMAARLAAGSFPPFLHGFAGGLNRVDDAPVAGAAAEMAVERLGDGVADRRSCPAR